MELERAPLPIGRSGRLHAAPLTNSAGSHAILVREVETARALLTGEPPEGGRERLVVVPLDDDVEVRVDGDALAVWLADGLVVSPPTAERVPAWASLLGFVLLLAMVAFAVIGSVTFAGWVIELLGSGLTDA